MNKSQRLYGLVDIISEHAPATQRAISTKSHHQKLSIKFVDLHFEEVSAVRRGLTEKNSDGSTTEHST